MKRGFSLAVSCMILFSLVNVSALSLIIHVPEKYIDVVAGERFYFEVDVKYPENLKRKNLIFQYELITADGDLVAISKVLKAVETQASFIDFIVVPESAEFGLYLINVNIRDSESLDEEISASFHVTSGSGYQIKLYFFILLGVIVLIGILIVFTLFNYKKKAKKR